MAITITITDPQDHAPYELQVLAQYFQALANDMVQARTERPGYRGKHPATAAPYERTTHDEEVLSDEERAALLDTIARAGLEEPAAEAIAGTSKALRDQSTGPFMNAAEGLRASAGGDKERAALRKATAEPQGSDGNLSYAQHLSKLDDEQLIQDAARADAAIRASAGGDQEPYALNAGGSDDFAELRDDPKSDASTPADASDGKTAPAGLDSSGLPWDERIHSSSKAQNADGTWRYKRGGDLDERKRVEAELRGIPQDLKGVQGGSGDFDPADLPTVEDDVPPPPADDDIPPPPVEVEEDLPPPPPPVEEEPVDMGKVFRAITEGQKAGLTQDKLAACLKAVGLSATQDIIGKPVEILAPLLQLIKEASA